MAPMDLRSKYKCRYSRNVDNIKLKLTIKVNINLKFDIFMIHLVYFMYKEEVQLLLKYFLLSYTRISKIILVFSI